MGTIENVLVSDDTMQRLREAAASHGRTVKEEAAVWVTESVRRQILQEQQARQMKAVHVPEIGGT